jgi:hypothetical protein
MLRNASLKPAARLHQWQYTQCAGKLAIAMPHGTVTSCMMRSGSLGQSVAFKTDLLKIFLKFQHIAVFGGGSPVPLNLSCHDSDFDENREASGKAASPNHNTTLDNGVKSLCFNAAATDTADNWPKVH